MSTVMLDPNAPFEPGIGEPARRRSEAEIRVATGRVGSRTRGEAAAGGRALALAAAGLAILAAFWFLAPVQDWLAISRTGIASLGLYGPLLFLLIYVAAALAFVPASALSLTAGLLYGTWGIALSWAALMIAAALSFRLARGLLLGPAEAWLAGRPRLRMVVAVVGEEGWRAVLLVRLSGLLPFALQNVVLALTPVGTGPYLAATAVGILPNVVLVVGLGSVGEALLTGESASPARFGALALAGLASGLLVAITSAKVRRRLGRDRREGDVPET